MSPQTMTANKDQAVADGFSAAINLDEAAPGSSFQATWIFKNSGSTTWNGRYRFAYTLTPHTETEGFATSPLGGKAAWTFAELKAPDTISPGESVALTLTFTVPNQAGTYATNWQLQSPQGQRFGPIRWLRVVVTETASVVTDTLAYDVLDFSNSAANFNNIQPGLKFKGTWTLRNTGTSPWSGDFKIAYIDGATADTNNSARSQMGAPATNTLRNLTGKDQVNPGETVTIPLALTAPTEPGSYAFHWTLQDENGRSFGGTRWLQIGVAGSVIGTPISTPTGRTQFGMNVNINPGGHGLDVERLDGLDWVRFVYWASREKMTPEEAYQKRYRHIIQSYASKGIRSLIILHQDTYWGNGPWRSGGWDSYADNFALACGRVAKMCSEFGDMVAYQVYNEQDSGFGNDAHNKNESAIGITPENYAKILGKAAPAIRAAHQGAKVIYGGLKTGPGNAINYTKIVQEKLGGSLPVDAIAYHPYGRFVRTAIFNFGSIGTIADAFNLFKQAFPGMPIWVTEVGAAADNPITSEHYEKIATYLSEVIEEVDGRFPDLVPVLIWFGWTDLMRNAGVLTLDGKPKAHIYDAFSKMKDRDKSLAKSADIFEEINEATFVSYTSTINNPNAVPAGSEFTSRWTFKNTGNTTWGSDYKLAYSPKGANPAAMTSKTSFKLSEVANKSTVEPNETVEISLSLTAPDTSGRTYRSQWQIRDPQGEAFGYLYDELTVIPASTAGTSVRAADMKFVKDQTAFDNTRFVAGTDFDKQWQVKNTGTRHWGSGFRLVYLEGDLQMAHGMTTHLVPEAKPGETVTLTVAMTAPPARLGQPTVYSTMWRMQDDKGILFGDPLWAKIMSTTAVSSTNGGDTALARLLNDPTMWYSQHDTSWARDQLGTGRSTIGSWGCLLTCMAMGLSAYGHRITPKDLNQAAIQKGKIAIDGSAIQFWAPHYIGGLTPLGNMRSWESPELPWTIPPQGNPLDRIDKALAEGKIVLAQVDTKPNNGIYNSDNEQHWVIIVKRIPDGSDYLMIDPITPPEQVHSQPRSLMAKYGSPIPSRSHDENIRNAIKSALIYHKSGGSGS